MATVIVCDICDDKKPLGKESFVVTIRKFTKRTVESEEYQDFEWDVCASCFKKVHAVGFTFEEPK